MISGRHYETLLACGVRLSEVYALAAEAWEARETAPDTERDTEPMLGVAPTVRSRRGAVEAMPITFNVVVAA